MKRISTRLAVSFLIVALLPTLPLSLVVRDLLERRFGPAIADPLETALEGGPGREPRPSAGAARAAAAARRPKDRSTATTWCCSTPWAGCSRPIRWPRSPSARPELLDQASALPIPDGRNRGRPRALRRFPGHGRRSRQRATGRRAATLARGHGGARRRSDRRAGPAAGRAQRAGPRGAELRRALPAGLRRADPGGPGRGHAVVAPDGPAPGEAGGRHPPGGRRRPGIPRRSARAPARWANWCTSFDTMVGRLAEQRRDLARLERAAAWRGMARTLAHEVKNPLTPILLAVQQARDNYQGDDAEVPRPAGRVRRDRRRGGGKPAPAGARVRRVRPAAQARADARAIWSSCCATWNSSTATHLVLDGAAGPRWSAGSTPGPCAGRWST